MNDIPEVKRQVEQLVTSLIQRRSDASIREQKALREAQTAKEEGDILAKTLEVLQPLGQFYSRMGIAQAQQETEGQVKRGHNREVVMDILAKAGGAMRTADIAKTAYEQKLIKSKKGYEGVYATVSTVLSRGKNVFVNADGKWDLRSRRKPHEGPFSLLTRLGPEKTTQLLADKIEIE
jgi:hypothetical protein